MVYSVKKAVCFSVDLEEDLPPYIERGYRGIHEGLSRLLDVLSEFKTNADFFVTGEVLSKFPSIVKRVMSEGHILGCHGLRHELLCGKPFQMQYQELSKATEKLKKVTGEDVVMFRAPMFGIDGTTIKALDRLGYRYDSSVLHNRMIRKHRVFTLSDMRNAPRKPYHPSYDDIAEEGEANLLEIPLTENPDARATPIGMGYLNLQGSEKTFSLIKRVKASYVTFLIHPWECIDLGRIYPSIPEPWHRLCKSDMLALRDFIKRVKQEFEIATLQEIGADYEE